MFAIETKRLHLRLFQPTDLDDYFAIMHNDSEVMRYITGTTLPIDATRDRIDRYQQHYEKCGYTVWAVTDKVTQRFMGHGGLMTLPNGKDVEVDYGLGQAYWGKGYATETARAVLRYGFEEAGLQLIYALAFPANRASIRVMQKLGMTYHGNRRQFYNFDLEIYSIDPAGLNTNDMIYRVTH